VENIWEIDSSKKVQLYHMTCSGQAQYTAMSENQSQSAYWSETILKCKNSIKLFDWWLVANNIQPCFKFKNEIYLTADMWQIILWMFNHRVRNFTWVTCHVHSYINSWWDMNLWVILWKLWLLPCGFIMSIGNTVKVRCLGVSLSRLRFGCLGVSVKA
jgi:hypothetical protein